MNGTAAGANATTPAGGSFALVTSVGDAVLAVVSNPAAVMMTGAAIAVAGQVLRYTPLFSSEGWEREVGAMAALGALSAAVLASAAPRPVGAAVLLLLWAGYFLFDVAAGLERDPAREQARCALVATAGALAVLRALPYAIVSWPFSLPFGLVAASLGAWAGSSAADGVYGRLRSLAPATPSKHRNAYTARISGYSRAPRPDGGLRQDYRLWLTRYLPRQVIGRDGEEAPPKARAMRYLPGLLVGRSGAGPAQRAEYGDRVSRYEERKGDEARPPAEAPAAEEPPSGAAEAAAAGPDSPGDGPYGRRVAYGPAQTRYIDPVPRFVERARLVLGPAAADRLAAGVGSLSPPRARAVVTSLLKVSSAVRRYNETASGEHLRISVLLEEHLLALLAPDGGGSVDVVWLGDVAADLLRNGIDPRTTLAVFSELLARERGGAFALSLTKKRELGRLAERLAGGGTDPAGPLREGLVRLGYL